MLIRSLHDSDFDAVLTAFNEAFSDYVVPINLAEPQLREMMRRRGYAPHLSAAAFEDGAIVSFVLNCLDVDRSYNMGTGVVPSRRRRGLSRAVLEATVPTLRAAGARAYLLEVIETNTPAVALYENSGFRESRRLQCWTFAPDVALAVPGRTVETPRWDEWRNWWNVEPSWQNSIESLRRAGDTFTLIGDQDAYGVFFPATGDLTQLAVKPESRRRRAGTELLHEAVALAGRPLRILNVDDRDETIAAFLQAAGANRTVRQIEMVRPP